jgi:23S rRNA (pseudouridine1915-N3)-methyltransferase
MRIGLIVVGAKQPRWVQDAYTDYAERLRGSCRLELVELPLGTRSSADPTRAVDDEGRRMLAALPAKAHVVALERGGDPWSTEQLAERLARWMGQGGPVALLVGGPDGLAPACRARAAEQWSLSQLTLPHGLVRIIVAEALYRAWSLGRGHPYHRA